MPSGSHEEKIQKSQHKILPNFSHFFFYGLHRLTQLPYFNTLVEDFSCTDPQRVALFHGGKDLDKLKKVQYITFSIYIKIEDLQKPSEKSRLPFSIMFGEN